MMNKKILIASLFATLILLVPMTSVVGVSDVEEDCECQDVNRYDLFRVKLLLVRIKVITNILLLRFGHIPEVADKCFDILENLDLNKLQGSPIICAILEPIWDRPAGAEISICKIAVINKAESVSGSECVSQNGTPS